MDERRAKLLLVTLFTKLIPRLHSARLAVKWAAVECEHNTATAARATTRADRHSLRRVQRERQCVFTFSPLARAIFSAALEGYIQRFYEVFFLVITI